jgi:ABC-type multidrug transport system ATPase subunit
LFGLPLAGGQFLLNTMWCLQDVSGSVEAGELLALMGPSGAGKSTLMDILAGRKTMGNLSGTILVNDRPRRRSDKHHTAYVPQVRHFGTWLYDCN